MKVHIRAFSIQRMQFNHALLTDCWRESDDTLQLLCLLLSFIIHLSLYVSFNCCISCLVFDMKHLFTHFSNTADSIPIPNNENKNVFLFEFDQFTPNNLNNRFNFNCFGRKIFAWKTKLSQTKWNKNCWRFWRSENISRLDTKHKSLTQMTRTSNACLSAVRAKLKTFSSFNRFGVWILLFAIVIEQQRQREILPFENAMYGRLCVCLCDDDDVVVVVRPNCRIPSYTVSAHARRERMFVVG